MSTDEEKQAKREARQAEKAGRTALIDRMVAAGATAEDVARQLECGMGKAKRLFDSALWRAGKSPRQAARKRDTIARDLGSVMGFRSIGSNFRPR